MKNILVNALNRNFLPVMVKKVVKRFEPDTESAATQWAREQATSTTEEFCRNLDPALYEEILADIAVIERDGQEKLKPLGFDLGGGGNYVLLHFLVRKFKPSHVVETGVAAGWSSLSILRAFEKNGKGRLYSSDFPYFRLENPEKYVGYLVQGEEVEKDWHLDMRGDDVALPNIREKLSGATIDLFHYDSDKSYSGRTKAFKTLEGNFGPDTIIIFDDIQDNLHFKDFVEQSGRDYKVFEFLDKYVGLVGV